MMLFVHFLGLVLGMGAGVSNLFIGASNKTLSNEERPKFMLKLRALGHMGLTGIILLVVSGGYLASPYWSVIGSMPFFIAKLSLVVVLLILVVLIDLRWRGAVKNNGGPDLQALPRIGRFAFPISILILLLAILQFH